MRRLPRNVWFCEIYSPKKKEALRRDRPNLLHLIRPGMAVTQGRLQDLGALERNEKIVLKLGLLRVTKTSKKIAKM